MVPLCLEAFKVFTPLWTPKTFSIAFRIRLYLGAQVGWANLGLCGQCTVVSRNFPEAETFTSIGDDTRKSPDVFCLRQAVLLSHPSWKMLDSHACCGHVSTSIASTSSQRPHLVSQRKAKWFRSGVTGVMCSAERPPIKLIATDVDGTLLNSKQELTPAVEQAIKKAADLGVPVVPCVPVSPYHRGGPL